MHVAPGCLRRGFWLSLPVFVLFVAPAVSKFSRPSGSTGGDSCLCVRYCRLLNDYTGEVTSDKHPEAQFLQALRMPVDFVPFSRESVRSSLYKFTSGVKNHGQCGSRSTFSVQAVICSWCCLRVDAETVCSSHFLVASIAVSPSVSGSSRLLDVLYYSSGGSQ